jgi:hypothetical protein
MFFVLQSEGTKPSCQNLFCDSCQIKIKDFNLEMPLNKNPARDCFLGSKTEEE